MKLALLSDIHEDVVSLELALQKISRYQCDIVVCLGDISGYNPRYHDFINHRNASACLQLLKKNNAIIVAGNHDLHSCKKLPYLAEEEEITEKWFNLDHATKVNIAGDKFWLYADELDPLFTDTDIQFLKDLPHYYILEEQNTRILFSHYLYPNLNGFKTVLYNESEGFHMHLQFMEQHQCSFSFCGHAHVAGMMHLNKTLHNISFKKEIKLTSNDVVIIPPVIRSNAANGFCIFDTETNTVVALRI